MKNNKSFYQSNQFTFSLHDTVSSAKMLTIEEIRALSRVNPEFEPVSLFKLLSNSPKEKSV
jgi:hypothetical protein